MRSTGIFVVVAVIVLSCEVAGLAAAQDLGTLQQYEKVELSFPYLSEPTFLDVPLDYWAFDGIEACAAARVVAGYPNATYRPTDPIDRAQMAVFITRVVAGGDEHIPTAPSTASFPDVPTGHWAFAYVEYGKQLGLLHGYGDGRFWPDLQLDRAQAAVFVARAVPTPTGTSLADYTPPPAPTFADVDPGSWAYKYIEFLAYREVVHGYPDGLYHPEDTYTRDQLAVFISHAFDLTVPLGGDGGNPFDPAVIDVEAEFTTPSGKTITVPGFYYRPYQRSFQGEGDSGEEVLSPEGPPAFHVRFAWGEIGEYSYQVSVDDVKGERDVAAGTFTVIASGDKGYVHPSQTAPNHLQYDSGRSYFAIGGNMWLADHGGTYDLDLWMGDLVRNGGNFIRDALMDVKEWTGLERLSVRPGDGLGLGRYDQAAAWRLDYIFDLAHRLDVEMLLCLSGAGGLAVPTVWLTGWDENPYNFANGGPCQAPLAFFTDAEARRLFKQELRYLIARWGYATSLLGWELSTEMDTVARGNGDIVADWHREMAAYLRGADPWTHPISVSFSQAIIVAGCTQYPALAGAPGIDLFQSHYYDAHEAAETISRMCRQYNRTYGRPYLIGEFGAGWAGLNLYMTDQSLVLHEGMWASTLSPAAGAAMPWGWGKPTHDWDLYAEFAPVASFAADIDWVKENYQPAVVTGLRYLPGFEPTAPATLAIEPPNYSCKDGTPFNLPGQFVVGNDGAVSGLVDALSSELYGPGSVRTNPATFVVDYPVPGKFEVLVWGVWWEGGAGLSISVDGEELLAQRFPPAVDDYKGVSFAYNGLYGVEVAAGPHTILVQDTGPDLLYASYRLTNYLTSPNLLVLAVSNPTSALAWVQNKEATWWNAFNGLKAQPVPASEFTLTGFEPGTYAVERWDTYEGAIFSTTTTSTVDGAITITTPNDLRTDVAYKVRRVP